MNQPVAQKDKPVNPEWNLFRSYLWSSSSQAERNQAEDLALQAGYSRQQIYTLIELATTAKRVAAELESILDQDGEEVALAWLEKQKHQHWRVVNNLNYSLEKWRKRRQKQKSYRSSAYRSSLQPLVFEGEHPNSLLALQPHDHWQIYIDETGNQFDDNANDIGLRDRNLGRVAALAVPVGRVDLPLLKKGFHSNKEEPAEVDKAVSTLLQQPVGILGITVHDASLRHLQREWLVTIDTLMRWLLRSLPLSQRSTVEFIIEGRSGYEEGVELGPLLEAIRADFDTLYSGERRVKISARFVGKDAEPLHSYADVVNFTWGSQTKPSRQRLSNSRWLGHCLLENDEDSLLRLLEALNNSRTLSADIWYRLMRHLYQLPAHSLVHNALNELQSLIRQRPKLWRVFLRHCQQQLQDKNYHPHQLRYGLGWLKACRPENISFPPILELEWMSLELAERNHRGELPSKEDLVRFGALIEQLEREDSRHCLQATLRIAISFSNAMHFDMAWQLLEPWLQVPVVQIGLLSYGKLLSCCGQVAALKGQLKQAIDYFDRALEAFGQLSDPEEAKPELHQTRCYRLLALTDQGQITEAMLANYYRGDQQNLNRSSIQLLARRDSIAATRQQNFDHYLLLRAMVLTPQLQHLHDLYLACESEWGSGHDHPWPLINYYRGWLLKQAGREAQARSYWDEAITLAYSEGSGAVLQWMGLVMASSLTADQDHQLGEDDSLSAI